MTEKGLFSVGDFAQLSRTTRATLHHYDTIGLLSPIARGDNSYRYYSRGQLAVINVIRTLQALGMPLNEIAVLVGQRTPERTDEMLARQIETIDRKISDWTEARKLLCALQDSIHSVLNVDEGALTIQYLPAAAIVLGDLNVYGRGKDDYHALLVFYRSVRERFPDMNLHYPVWGRFSAQRICAGDWKWPDRFYFYHPEGGDARPAALYAIGYTRGGYGQCGALYERMIRYIDENGFEICADAYEEYPLNEVCIADSGNYLMRVMITVREKPEAAR